MIFCLFAAQFSIGAYLGLTHQLISKACNSVPAHSFIPAEYALPLLFSCIQSFSPTFPNHRRVCLALKAQSHLNHASSHLFDCSFQCPLYFPSLSLCLTRLTNLYFPWWSHSLKDRFWGLPCYRYCKIRFWVSVWFGRNVWIFFTFFGDDCGTVMLILYQWRLTWLWRFYRIFSSVCRWIFYCWAIKTNDIFCFIADSNDLF